MIISSQTIGNLNTTIKLDDSDGQTVTVYQNDKLIDTFKLDAAWTIPSCSQIVSGNKIITTFGEKKYESDFVM